MQINVVDKDYPEAEHIFVNKRESICFCDMDNINPVLAVNLDSLDDHIDTVCGGIVTYNKLSRYNRFWGYSGYDEANDD